MRLSLRKKLFRLLLKLKANVVEEAACLVDIKGANDDHLRWPRKVAMRHRHQRADKFAQDVDVVFQDRRYRDDRRLVSRSTLETNAKKTLPKLIEFE